MPACGFLALQCIAFVNVAGTMGALFSVHTVRLEMLRLRAKPDQQLGIPKIESPPYYNTYSLNNRPGPQGGEAHGVLS